MKRPLTVNGMQSVDEVEDYTSIITDEQIIYALEELYGQVVIKHTGHLCIEYNHPNNSLEIYQYPIANSYTVIEADGKMWHCPHVHCVYADDTINDILDRWWGYTAEELPNPNDEKECDDELLRAVYEADIPERMIESVREKINAYLSSVKAEVHIA